MALHVAIVTPPYDRMILDGRKRIESRLTRTARPPFGCVAPGDALYFKRSGGAFFARAEAARVLMADRLTPGKVDALAERYNGDIGGAPEFWAERRGTAKFATLIWLRDVRPIEVGPRYRTINMRAWYTLDDGAAPDEGGGRPTPPPASTFEVTLSEAAVRQRTVRIARHLDHFPAACVGGARRGEAGEPLTLELIDGPTIETDVDGARKMIRWRGWGGWFEARGIVAGDRLQFTRTGERHFEVRAERGDGE